MDKNFIADRTSMIIAGVLDIDESDIIPSTDITDLSVGLEASVLILKKINREFYINLPVRGMGNIVSEVAGRIFEERDNKFSKIRKALYKIILDDVGFNNDEELTDKSNIVNNFDAGLGQIADIDLSIQKNLHVTVCAHMLIRSTVHEIIHHIFKETPLEQID